MKPLRQLLLVFTICFIGDFISRIISIPIPGNIIGMILLFTCLLTGVIKLEMIDGITKFLTDHLAFFFLPAGVGIITSFDVIKANWAALLCISVLSTIVVMVVTGYVVQTLKRGLEKNDGII